MTVRRAICPRAIAALIVGLAAIADTAAHAQERTDAPDRRRVEVKSVSFTGVTAINQGDLAASLGTRASAWLPWGTKRYFSRNELNVRLEMSRRD